jgi:hypothetical protein
MIGQGTADEARCPGNKNSSHTVAGKLSGLGRFLQALQTRQGFLV